MTRSAWLSAWWRMSLAALLLGAGGCGAAGYEAPTAPPVIAVGEASKLHVRVELAGVSGQDAGEVEQNAHWSTAVPLAVRTQLQVQGFNVVGDTQAADVVVRITVSRVQTASAGSNTVAQFTFLMVNAGSGAFITNVSIADAAISYNDWPEVAANRFCAAIVRSAELHSFAQTMARPPQVAHDTPAPTSAPVAPAPTVATAPTAPTPSAHAVVGLPQRTTYAVVIGIDHYRDLPAAGGARADAESFAGMLKSTMGVPETNIRLAVDDHATRTDVQQSMAWLKANVPAGGRAIFFFSGHGSPAEGDGSAFMVPYDASPSAVTATAISVNDATASVGASKAKDAIMVLDTCFSGAGGRSVLPVGARPLVRVRESEPTTNLAIFASSSGAQISGPSLDGKQGLFTKYVVEGISSGQADTDGDGQLTLKELAEWVTPRVAREARQGQREQTPRLVTGKGIGDPGNLPVVWGIK